jgi:hypothetical protein
MPFLRHRVNGPDHVSSRFASICFPAHLLAVGVRHGVVSNIKQSFISLAALQRLGSSLRVTLDLTGRYYTMAEEPDAADVADAATASSDQGEVIGSSALRPVFLGNLMNVYTPEDVTAIFERPQQPKGDKVYTPVPVDRIDLKRGYCFVFLKDAVTQEDKINAERFVSAINGM